MTYINLYAQEYLRATTEHPPEEWAALTPFEMVQELRKEVEELAVAVWMGDLDGKHGIIREAIHVEIVARRIREEMKRRGENESTLEVEEGSR